LSYTNPWKDETKVELLKDLVPLGLSAAQMAARIGGGVTRNAVIGKIHRLGLAGSPDRQVLRKKRQRSRAERSAAGTRWRRPMTSRQNRVAELFDAESFTPTPELVIPEHERKTIQTLTDVCCRWPIGDPQHTDFHFCGRRKVPSLPYCEFHARRAFQPPQPQQRRAQQIEHNPPSAKEEMAT
jgi:GcrA cell cycle regulator